MKVKPKLYLNMSPQTAEEGSLAFARNMKIDDDGNLVSDYGYKVIDVPDLSTPTRMLSTYSIVGHIVGLDNKIYLFTDNDVILEYDELKNKITKQIAGYWNYGGGEIDGCVNTNISGEKILTIAEYQEGGQTPLKHINISKENYYQVEESLYSQAPSCPTANLVLKDTYVKTIPNGVYVFFIRYKIRKDVYTNWFLCSRPIFGGTSEKITTLQGGLSYINLHKDSAKSFVFQLDFAQAANKDSYKEFQLGFIITHDEATDARIWKHFNISDFVTTKPHYHEENHDDENLIYFDYEDVQEANIDDLLETTYELYNVRNVTAFKNKLYISNYIESNFNPDNINTLKDYIKLEVAHSKEEGSTDIDYKNMSYNGNSLHYDYNKGYYDKTKNEESIADIIQFKDFTFDVSKLAKVDSKEKSDVVRFDVFWNPEIDPDVALVYNIYNDLHNKVIFGRDWQTPIPNSYGDADKLSTVGLKLVDSGNNAYIYAPLANRPGDALFIKNHPWYNLGFTFGFGSYNPNEVGVANYELGCSLFNAYTYNWESNYIKGHDSSKYGWFSRDSGFGDFAKNTIENVIQREVEGRSFFAKAYLEIASGANTYTIDYQESMDLDNYAGNNMDINLFINGTVPRNYQNDIWRYYSDNHLTILNPASFSTTILSIGLSNDIKQWTYNLVHDKIIGIDENGTPVINIGTNEKPIIVRANSISVKFKKFDFKVDNEDIDTSEGHYVKRFKISLTTTDYTSLCTFSIQNKCFYITDNGVGAEQVSTLMPFSKYQPYVHFVDEHNIVTNGVKLDAIETGNINSNDDTLYLKYKVLDTIPDSKYKSFFISLVNIGDIIIEGFGYTKDPNNKYTNILHCIEIDTLLYNINDNITIKLYSKSTGELHKTITDARYYSSGSNYPPLAFGNCGYVTWEDDTENNTDWSNYNIYIIISRNKSSENIKELTKASGYIPLTEQTTAITIPDGYYGSWLSFVKKPSFELSSSCYVSGRDVYAVNRTTALSLTDFKSFIQVQDSVTYFVRSNFNLNYLSLTEDINDSIFTVGSASSGVKQVARVINSTTLSFIYELKSMYKDFSNKYFRPIDTDYKIDFDNTIRVSYVLSDETFNNSIFKFGAKDYYNVPTDRGIIVNLFSIGNNIYVHTKGSLYKFDATQTITASDKDIQLQESEPFDVGISQIFDSEYGYGGIFNKQAGCITFDSYFFYDQESNHIFAYGGNGQVQLIDASIYKLLNYYKPKYCRTLHDDANHRVLFEFTSSKTEGIFTLSFNYKSKSFVSFHDISLDKAFLSRNASYSYRGAFSKLFDTSNGISQTKVDEDLNIYSIYGAASAICIVQFGAATHNVQDSPFIASVIGFPRENFREVIDYITYLGDVVQNAINTQTEDTDTWDVIKLPQVTRNNPVKSLYIITDACISTVVNETVDDTIRPENLIPEGDKVLNYKGFKYVKGFWNANYFRNAINTNNIYNYPNQPRANQSPNSDNYSLVYGRYFILNFAFIPTSPIKFEELFINTQQY